MKFLRTIAVFSFAIVAFSLSACSSGVSGSISVRDIDESGVTKVALANSMDLKVTIGNVYDSRHPTIIGEVDGRFLEPYGDVASSVKMALERHFAAAGVTTTLFDAATLNAEVNRWYVTVNTGSFMSEAVAVAQISVSLFDRSTNRTYSATYAGEASVKDPFLGENDVKKVLGNAMSYAIRQAINDQKLLERLAVY